MKPSDKKHSAYFRELLDKIQALEESKGEDYEAGGVEFTDYYPEGLSDLWLILHGKTLRLKSLVRGGKEPNHESVADNALDLAVYALKFAVWARIIQEGKGPQDASTVTEEK